MGRFVVARPRYGAFALAAGVALIGIPSAAADDSPVLVGGNCRGDQLGQGATALDGTVLRCLAADGGFTWVADAGAVGTIAELQKQGYTVVIDRIGTGSLSACKVTDVRNPVTTAQTTGDPLGGPHTPGGVTTITLSRTVSVSLECTEG